MCLSHTIFHDLDVYVISLDKTLQRTQSLVQELQKQGFSVHIMEAINGRKLLAEEYFRQCRIKSSRYFRRKMFTPSELGCWLSHKKTLEQFVAGDKRWVMILEDDVTLVNDLSSLASQIPRLEENVIFIMGGQNGLVSFKRVLFLRDKTGLRRAVSPTHRWLYRTCCYLTGRAGAWQLIGLMNKSCYLADDWAYIVNNTSIKKIYYQYYFSHPEDLVQSTIEWERQFISKK